MGSSTKYQHHLELQLGSNSGQTICQHQYTTYPLRLSPLFRLEGAKSQRGYLYLINTSPGLLAGDTLNLFVKLTEGSSLYFTDQAATKVHPMPIINTKAKIDYQLEIESEASLELMPEPIILYTDATLEQNTKIKLHPNANLFLSEIILPGRLAKAESYQFNYFWNQLQIVDRQDRLLFCDAMRLQGKHNPFQNQDLFASLPILGNAIAILPAAIDLNKLISTVESQTTVNIHHLETALTTLPEVNGILIRAMANKTYALKNYFASVLNCVRQITQQPSLPYIPK